MGDKMILAAHQPGYLPWPGFFHKMLRADIYVLADDIQYEKKNWQNRNKIRTAEGSMWLTIPVFNKGFRRINQVKIAQNVNWKSQHWKALWTNYGRAPFFQDYAPFFKEIYADEWHNLIDINLKIIDLITDDLDISTDVHLSSEISTSGSKTEYIISLCKHFDADCYLSGNGAKSYIEAELFKRNGIELRYQSFTFPEYPQRFNPFIPSLSIVDMLFNVGRKTTKTLLNGVG